MNKKSTQKSSPTTTPKEIYEFMRQSADKDGYVTLTQKEIAQYFGYRGSSGGRFRKNISELKEHNLCVNIDNKNNRWAIHKDTGVTFDGNVIIGIAKSHRVRNKVKAKLNVLSKTKKIILDKSIGALLSDSPIYMTEDGYIDILKINNLKKCFTTTKYIKLIDDAYAEYKKCNATIQENTIILKDAIHLLTDVFNIADEKKDNIFRKEVDYVLEKLKQNDLSDKKQEPLSEAESKVEAIPTTNHSVDTISENKTDKNQEPLSEAESKVEAISTTNHSVDTMSENKITLEEVGNNTEVTAIDSENTEITNFVNSIKKEDITDTTVGNVANEHLEKLEIETGKELNLAAEVIKSDSIDDEEASQAMNVCYEEDTIDNVSDMDTSLDEVWERIYTIELQEEIEAIKHKSEIELHEECLRIIKENSNKDIPVKRNRIANVETFASRVENLITSLTELAEESNLIIAENKRMKSNMANLRKQNVVYATELAIQNLEKNKLKEYIAKNKEAEKIMAKRITDSTNYANQIQKKVRNKIVKE